MEEKLTLAALLARIQSDDPDVRTQAWLAAGAVGAQAIKPLAAVICKTEPVIAELAGDPKNKDLELALETGRAAKRAMWKIVRTAGAPGQGAKKKAVEAELIDLLAPSQPAAVRREVVWMLSEIGGGATLTAMRDHPELLDDKLLREDARSMVERIPGDGAVALLTEALEEAPEDFKINIAQSLRARGVKVDPVKYPCQKLVPTKATSVKPVGR
jgi:hypothetical protein